MHSALVVLEGRNVQNHDALVSAGLGAVADGNVEEVVGHSRAPGRRGGGGGGSEAVLVQGAFQAPGRSVEEDEAEIVPVAHDESGGRLVKRNRVRRVKEVAVGGRGGGIISVIADDPARVNADIVITLERVEADDPVVDASIAIRHPHAALEGACSGGDVCASEASLVRMSNGAVMISNSSPAVDPNCRTSTPEPSSP